MKYNSSMSTARYLPIAGGAALLAAAIGAIAMGWGEDSSTAQAATPDSVQVSNSLQPASGSAANVEVIQPTVDGLRRTTTQPAHIEPFERTDIHAKSSGYLSEVLVDIGDRVQKGQVIAKLWIPEMVQERAQKASLVDDARAAVEQAQAKIASASAAVGAAEANLAVARANIGADEADVAYRRAEHDRIAKLVETRAMNAAIMDEKRHWLRSAESAFEAANASEQSAAAGVTVSQAGKRQAEADLARSEAQLRVAEANLKHTEIMIDYAQIVAPYDGLITRRWVDSGDFVRSAHDVMTDPLFTIDRDDRLRVVFDIPESQSSQIRVDQPTSLVVDALKGRTFEGRVTRTAGVLDPKTRTLRAEVELESAETGLRPGMYGMITVVLADRPQAVLIPSESLRYEAGRPFVLCAANGVVERRAVTIGYSDSSTSEILSGIGPNDLVVANAKAQLRVGETVRIAQAP